MNEDPPFYPYRVEKINQHQKSFFYDLFNQYRFGNGETSEKRTDCPREKLSSNAPVFFIVSTNDSASVPVGFIQLNFMYSSIQTEITTVIHELYVLPDYRKKGAALQLVQAAIRFAIHNRSVVIQLETSPDNRTAKKLFESVGFKCQTSESSYIYSIQFLTRNA
jgi:ribosomal protein S18 acetylase RimI-like enzyme